MTMTSDDDETILDGPRERVFRETLLYRATPADRAALSRLARMMFEYVDAHEPERQGEGHVGLRDALLAASRDIRSLRDYLVEAAKVYVSNKERGHSGIALSALASSYAKKLGRLADWLDWQLGVSPFPREKRAATDPAED